MNAIDGMLDRLRVAFSLESFADLLGGLIVKIVVVALILLTFYVVWYLLSLVIKSRLSRLDKTSVSFVNVVIKVGLFGVGLIAALSAVGIQTAALLGSLGVVGLTLGFALRDVLSNIISGILLHLDRPFTVDDLVEVDGKYGRVDLITLRTTRIITNDGKMMAVPNAEVMNKTVVSYTNFPHLRLDVSVTVAVTEDIDQARKVLLAQVENDPDCMALPEPRVVVAQLNDYNVALELQVWIKDERQHIKKSYELRERMFKALTQAGIEMPCETIQLARHTVDVEMAER